MMVSALVCIFQDPTSGIIAGVLLSMVCTSDFKLSGKATLQELNGRYVLLQGKGAWKESRADVICKLRQGSTVVTTFHCNLVLLLAL